MDKPSAILPGALEQLRVKEQKPAAGSNELGQEAFFDLMVTQLQNQDPMNPMESGDFLGQIAQFSTVNGISELQESFATLASSLQSSQALQASTMVGRTVVLASDSFGLGATGGARVAASLPQTAQNVRVTISDSLGQVVRQSTLGQQAAGPLAFEWDGLDDNGGRAPAGRYAVRFDALINGSEQALSPTVTARVDSVSLSRDGQAPTLNVDGFGSVAMSDVLEIL